jgi:hypothetical protein
VRCGFSNDGRDGRTDEDVMKKASVVVRLFGGLGNQLFCYAAARRLALANQMQLKLDVITGFKWDHEFRRQYALDPFDLRAETASPLESFNYWGGRLCRRLVKWANGHVPFEKRSYIEEESIECFDPRMLNLRPRKNLYLQGYWHSEKYFKDVESIIRQDLTITAPHDSVTLRESEMIAKAENPVSLGIRLFQDVTKPGLHLVLPGEYYLAAAAKIVADVKNPHFFIFCNDRELAEQHLRLPYPHTFITPKPENERAYEDLWLMSLCKHFIIPNSTYHWWGSWLSTNQDKMVIAPERGFYNRDIIPAEWIQLPID